MKKYSCLLAFVLAFAMQQLNAAEYFWVGNGGNWNDTTHWATSSGGQDFFDTLPGLNDTVIFDANSFSLSGEFVFLNTPEGECAMMDWRTIDDTVFFSTWGESILRIHGDCMLSVLLTFDISGTLEIYGSGTSITKLDFAGNSLGCDLVISADSTRLFSKLNLPRHNLYLIDGYFYSNGYNVSCNHLNTASGQMSSVLVESPHWLSHDTLTIRGSMAIADTFDFQQYGPLNFNPNTSDSNYIRIDSAIIYGKVTFDGSKKIFLNSPFKVSNTIDFKGGGAFYTRGFPVSANAIVSKTPLNRIIDLSTSVISLHAPDTCLFLNPQGLTLKSDSASLFFDYSGMDTVRVFTGNNTNYKFAAVKLPSSHVMLFTSFQTSLLSLDTLSNLAMATGITLTIGNMSANNDCGHYNYIQAFCRACPTCDYDLACDTARPVFHCQSTIELSYIKIKNTRATGSAFVLLNSYDEGNTSGFSITSPDDPRLLYWVNGSGNWNEPNHWSASSGGTAADCIPTLFTDVVFDANSGLNNDSILIRDNAYCGKMSCQDLIGGVKFHGAGELIVADNMTIHSQSQIKLAGGILLKNTGSGIRTISANPANIECNLRIEGDAQWELADKLAVKGLVSLVKGSLALNGFPLQCAAFHAAGSALGTLDYSNSIITLTGSDTTWKIAGDNVTLNHTGAILRLSGNGPEYMIVDAGGKTFDTLEIQCPRTRIAGGANVKLLKIQAGSALECEPFKTIRFDSLSAEGSDLAPISISGYNNSPDTAIFALNDTNDNLIANYLIIKNVCTADSTQRLNYTANNSIGLNKFSGWNIPPTPTGKTYSWTGDSSAYWHDPDNWETSGTAASQPPGIKDVVLFDNSVFSDSDKHDTVIIDRNAWCKIMQWDNAIAGKPALLLGADLLVTDNVSLSDSLSVGYTGNVMPAGIDAALFILAPQAGKLTFHPSCREFKVNLSIQGKDIDDTVQLADNFVSDSLCSLVIVSGCFSANEKDILAGIVATEGNTQKSIDFRKSTITAAYSFSMQDTTSLSLLSDSSFVIMKDNSFYTNQFRGGGQTFHSVEFKARKTPSYRGKYTAFAEGSNTFKTLKINPGVHLVLAANSVQTLDSLSANGSCQDSVYLESPDPDSYASLDNVSHDSIRGICLNVHNIAVNGAGASARFSRGYGTNPGWYFNTSKRIVADFSLPPTSCFSDSTHFINSSTVFGDDYSTLTYTWAFGDRDSSSLFEPVHLYENVSKYNVRLVTTDTLSGCSDIHSDSIKIYKPFIYILSSEADTSICQGDSVTFMATSANTGPGLSHQFMVNDETVLHPLDSMWFGTTSLVHGDKVYVIETYYGCVDTSNQYTFTVDSLPIVGVTVNDADNRICRGTALEITGHGAEKYQVYLNGSAYGELDSNAQIIMTDLNDEDMLVLYGQDTSSGCASFSEDTIILTVYPLPATSLECSDTSLLVCSGTEVIFKGHNAVYYQFYLNGDSLGPVSTSDTMAYSSLVDGDTIGVLGISVNACTAFSNKLVFEVMPSPLVSISCSDPDLVICKGEQVLFQAFGADEYQFLIDGDSLGPFSNANSFSSDTLLDGQTINVSGRQGHCSTLAVTAIVMDVRPKVSMTWSAEQICAYDTITFIAHGDSLFTFYIDNIPVSPQGPDSIYRVSGLTNNQEVSVRGTEGACNPPPLTVTVFPFPSVNMACSDPDSILCRGDAVTFTGSGAPMYSFYVDGVETQAWGVINTFTTNALTNGQTVTMMARSSDNCSGDSGDSLVFAVYEYPTLAVSLSEPDQIICAGDTVSFTVSGADSLQFLVNGIPEYASGPAHTFVTATLVNEAVIVVKGTTGYCTASSQDFVYVVNPLPVVSLAATSPLSYCSGDSLILLAGGADAYEFFVAGVSTGLTTNNIFSSDSLSTGQTVAVTGIINLSGCYAPSNVTYSVTVNDYPEVSFTTDIATPAICYDDTVTFEGSGAQSYIFYLDGIPVSHDSVFTANGLEEGQIVTLHGGNGVCWIGSDTLFTIHTNYVPVTLSCLEPSAVACAGSPVTFEATGADLYEFFVDDVTQGAASANGSFTSSSLADGQLVSVAGTSLANGCLQKATGDFLVHILPLPMITVTPSAVVCEGDSAMLESSVTDGITWYRNGSLIPGVSSHYLSVLTEGNYAVQSVAGGNEAVHSAGANYYGQLGDGSLNNSPDFATALGLDDAISLACGSEFSLALRQNGAVISWGRNEFGALGNGTYTDAQIPVQAGSISNALKLGAGSRFAIALLADSTLLSWGENTYGQLGYGDYATSNFPFPVTGQSGFIDVAAGDNHCLAVKADGSVWAWGRNQFGQIGDSTLVMKNQPVKVSGIDNVVAVRAGGNHSMALRSDGTLWVWGANSNGQLGNGSFDGSLVPLRVNLPLPVAGFDAGFAHSIACDTAGHVYTWGDNTFGQIGNATYTTAVYPVKITAAGEAGTVRAGHYASYVIRADKNVFSWGQNTSGQLGQQHLNPVTQPEAVVKLFGISSIDGGSSHCAALRIQEHSCTSAGVWIQIDTIPPILVYRDELILQTNAQGIYYQWYYEGNPIPGANSNSISLGAEGIYQVMVTFANNCSGFSGQYGFYVGLEELDKEAGFTIFPNPNKGSFVIQFPTGSVSYTLLSNIRIVDMLGRCVLNLSPDRLSGTLPIDFTERPNGVYSVELWFDNKSVLRKRFVVND